MAPEPRIRINKEGEHFLELGIAARLAGDYVRKERSDDVIPKNLDNVQMLEVVRKDALWLHSVMVTMVFAVNGATWYDMML